MSLYDYRRALELHHADEPFASLVMAAMLRADTANAATLAGAFPALFAELDSRYRAGGGLLAGDPGFEEVQAEREALGLPPT